MHPRFTLSRLFVLVAWLAVCTWLGASAYHSAPKLWPLLALALGVPASAGAVGLIRGQFSDWLIWGLAIPVVLVAVLLALGW
jgi:hypothetical protein